MAGGKKIILLFLFCFYVILLIEKNLNFGEIIMTEKIIGLCVLAAIFIVIMHFAKKFPERF